MEFREADEFLTGLTIVDDAHTATPLREIIGSMMDFPIGPDIGVRAIRMFYIPVEGFLPTARRWMRNPLIALIIQVSSLRTSRRISQPIRSVRDVWVSPSAGQEPPRILNRPTSTRGSHSSFYSHSIVAGGLLLMSYTTRLTPATWLMMRVEIFASKS